MKAKPKMFAAFARDGELTDYEVQRLKSAESSDRFMNIMLETVNWCTNIAFVVVLFYQAGAVNSLPLDWAWFSATVGRRCPGDPPPANQTAVYLSLASAGAALLILNAVVRLVIAIIPVLHRRKAVLKPQEHAWLVLGILASVVDPWNGALIIEGVLDKRGEWFTPFRLLMIEIFVDIILLFFNK